MGKHTVGFKERTIRCDCCGSRTPHMVMEGPRMPDEKRPDDRQHDYVVETRTCERCGNASSHKLYHWLLIDIFSLPADKK